MRQLILAKDSSIITVNSEVMSMNDACIAPVVLSSGIAQSPDAGRFSKKVDDLSGKFNLLRDSFVEGIAEVREVRSQYGLSMK